MKKLLALLLSVVTCFCFAGCDVHFSNNSQSGSSCAHTYEWIARSGYGHQMVYTCGCPYDDGIEAHKDNNHDYQCDVCGWPMDGILPEIYPILYEYETWIWDLSADNVKEIKTTAEYVGVAPGRLKDIQRTTDKEVIEKVIADYTYNTTMQRIEREEALVTGGSAFTIEFILASGEVKELYFNNGVYQYYKPELSISWYFKMDKIPTLKQYTNVKNSYSFITYRPTYDLFTIDGEKVGEFDGIDRFEFVEYREPEIPDGEVAISPGEATHYIVGDIGTMYICSDKIFYMINGEQRIYYQLVGEEHFDDICYNDSLYKVTIVDKNNRFFDKPTEGYFEEGTIITLHCRPIMDADLVMYINGERVATQYVIDSEDGYLWEYSFVVPAEDVTVTFEISGGM